jgi:bifunctional non-homologous end joining protein LigD
MSPRAGGRLDDYNARRDFAKTAEPRGRAARRRRKDLLFLVQKHDARRLHYDLRLEIDGVLKSWAVTRGPSLDPADKRLAVRTEDHPMSYGDFEGTIPAGEYGGGTVMLWDTGSWEPVGDADTGLTEGKLHFIVHGARMKGEWILVRMRAKPGDKRENWLLMKADDGEATGGRALTDRYRRSVATDRTIKEIAAGKDIAEGNPKTPRKSVKPASGGATTKRTSGARTSRRGKPPAFQKPQLATLVAQAPEGEDWLHEMKFDGYRCLVAVGGGTARCYTRTGLDWTDRFAQIAEACAELDCAAALIDGEVVAGESVKTSQFSALQDALKRDGELRYYAFDLLTQDGRDLRKTALTKRKQALKALLETLGGSHTVQYSEHVQGNGAKVFASVCRAGHEGIVSKRAGAAYTNRRTRDWLKVKCTRRQEFVIGGYSPSDKAGRAFSSLLLGTMETGKLVYRGRVGTGFSDDVLDELAGKLRSLHRRTSPFEDVPSDIARKARWTTPKLVAEIDFAELTDDGRVRHGSFLGLRADKGAEDVTLETRKMTSVNDDAEVLGVRISHPDRVVFAKQAVTKIDLARYYEAVAARMMPFLENRLVSLVRCPQGRSRSCFYQRHGGTEFPDVIARMRVKESSGQTDEYLYITNPEGIVTAVQMNTLEFHIWWSRIDDIDRPDRLVFDLDPDEALGFEIVRQAAFDLRERLDQIGLASLAMVTGGKGVHVVVPLVRRTGGDEAKAFAEAVARALADDEPDRFTATMSKARRKGRIFVDWLRNQRGATAIAPYSTRARDGAPVATPVSWSELKSIDRANSFRIADVVERLGEPDPWADAGDIRQSITAKMRKAVGL